jgi:hypothetical protein
MQAGRSSSSSSSSWSWPWSVTAARGWFEDSVAIVLAGPESGHAGLMRQQQKKSRQQVSSSSSCSLRQSATAACQVHGDGLTSQWLAIVLAGPERGHYAAV